MSEIQQYIIDQTGADDWDAVIEAFSGGSVEEIEDTLDDILPYSGNRELAQVIFDEVAKEFVPTDEQWYTGEAALWQERYDRGQRLF